MLARPDIRRLGGLIPPGSDNGATGGTCGMTKWPSDDHAVVSKVGWSCTGSCAPRTRDWGNMFFCAPYLFAVRYLLSSCLL